MKRSRPRKISLKRLAELGGKVPFSSIRKKSKKDKIFKDGRVRLANKSDLRRECFERDKGICQKHLRHGIKHYVSWEQGHMAHKAHAARKSDTLNEVEWSCPEAHLIDEHNPKSCPAKPKKILLTSRILNDRL